MPAPPPEPPDMQPDPRDEPLLSALIQALIPVDLPDAKRRQLRRRVLQLAAEDAPPSTQTVRAQEVTWQRLVSGVWMGVLERNVSKNLQVALLRMEAGSVVPGHAHTRDEECFVLEGELLIGTHRVCRGDFHIARAGGTHPDITAPDGALLILRSEIPSIRR